MNFLYQSAFLKALGWALLNSLWQMALLWLVYLALTMGGKKLLSRQRHAIALLSLTGGSLWFLTTLVINLYKAASGPQVITILDTDPAFTTGFWPDLINRWFEPALPFLSVAYLLTAMFLFVRFYFQYRHTQRLFTIGLQKADPEWRIFLQQAVQHMGVKKKVQIWLSSLIDTPVTLGVFKPVILLPVAAINHLSLKQAEAIILHELNHIRRNDYLVNLLISCVDVVMFFNPFARSLTNIIRKERENCCDDMVLQFRYEPATYARALLSLEQNRINTNALALAATGKDKHFLLNRVKRILGNEQVSNPFSQKLVAYLLSALLIAFIGWYNPGNVIIKRLDLVQEQTPSMESGLSFATPVIQVAMTEPVAKAALAERIAKPICKKDTTSITDAFRHLEQIIELTTDARLSALTKRLEEMPEEMAFVNNMEMVNYSLADAGTQDPQQPLAQDVYPYVPAGSFYFQAVEDTSLPKKYVLSKSDLKAQQTMDRSMQALQQMDWKNLEQKLKAQGMKVNITQLQEEIEKAMSKIDWKKMETETENALNEANNQIQKMNNAFTVQLGNYQRNRVIQQERIKEAQRLILIERLQQHEELKKLEAEKKKGVTVKKRKIVQI